jgi:hypothetical protein
MKKLPKNFGVLKESKKVKAFGKMFEGAEKVVKQREKCWCCFYGLVGEGKSLTHYYICKLTGNPTENDTCGKFKRVQ